ncbi:MAG: flagellar motor switch protein FliN [Solirubrobacteraceae bacterium]|jgi:flagellar motor switch protein FliN/FliY
MPEDLDYEPLQAQASAGNPAVLGQATDLTRLREVPVELTVEIGRARMTVGETLGLRPGSTVKLDRLAEEPLDLLVNGTRIARGEVVVIDEEFGLRITEVVSGGEATLSTSAALAAPGELATQEPEPPELVEAEVVNAA